MCKIVGSVDILADMNECGLHTVTLQSENIRQKTPLPGTISEIPSQLNVFRAVIATRMHTIMLCQPALGCFLFNG